MRGEEAVKILDVIQIPLTFSRGMFAGFFEKGNHKKQEQAFPYR